MSKVLSRVETGVKCVTDCCSGEIVTEVIEVHPGDAARRIMGIGSEGAAVNKTFLRCSNCCRTYDALPEQHDS